MSNDITIPFVDYRMDKAKALILAIVIVVVILIATGSLGNIISSLFKGAITGLGNTIDTVVGNPTTSQSQSIGSATSANNYGKQVISTVNGQPTTTSGPFSQSLYNANAAASNLTLPQLQAAVSAIWYNLGSNFFGLNTSQGDAYALYQAFSDCQSQTDVSNIAVEYYNEHGEDLLNDILFGTDNVLNFGTAGDQQANDVWVNNLITWAQKLPVT